MFFYLLYKYTLRNAWYGRQELNEKGKFAKDILAKKHIPHILRLSGVLCGELDQCYRYREGLASLFEFKNDFLKEINPWIQVKMIDKKPSESSKLLLSLTTIIITSSVFVCLCSRFVFLFCILIWMNHSRRLAGERHVIALLALLTFCFNVTFLIQGRLNYLLTYLHPSQRY